mgnify:CR=1 FL=1
MNKNLMSNLVLGALIFLTVAILGGLGEIRLDAYLSMFTLEYFIVLAVLRPRRRTKDFLAFVLLAIFFIIVGVRVAEILLT